MNHLRIELENMEDEEKQTLVTDKQALKMALALDEYCNDQMCPGCPFWREGSNSFCMISRKKIIQIGFGEWKEIDLWDFSSPCEWLISEDADEKGRSDI